MQCPKAPNVTEELRMSVLFVSITFRMAMSPMIGEEMVVTRRRMAARKMKTTPILFPRTRLAVPTRQMTPNGGRTNGTCEP
jgi:hypothetical protein